MRRITRQFVEEPRQSTLLFARFGFTSILHAITRVVFGVDRESFEESIVERVVRHATQLFQSIVACGAYQRARASAHSQGAPRVHQSGAFDASTRAVGANFSVRRFERRAMSYARRALRGRNCCRDI